MESKCTLIKFKPARSQLPLWADVSLGCPSWQVDGWGRDYLWSKPLIKATLARSQPHSTTTIKREDDMKQKVFTDYREYWELREDLEGDGYDVWAHSVIIL